MIKYQVFKRVFVLGSFQASDELNESEFYAFDNVHLFNKKAFWFLQFRIDFIDINVLLFHVLILHKYEMNDLGPKRHKITCKKRENRNVINDGFAITMRTKL